LVVGAECWVSRVYAATRVPNYYLIKKLSLQKKSKKGFKITEGFLS
jgi:hypothetical protein